jgi:hypothetical protein
MCAEAPGEGKLGAGAGIQPPEAKQIGQSEKQTGDSGKQRAKTAEQTRHRRVGVGLRDKTRGEKGFRVRLASAQRKAA